MKNLLLRQKSYLHIVLIVAVNVVTTAKGMENNEDVSMTVNNEDSSMTSYHAHLEPHIKNLLEGFNYNNRPANSAFLKDVLLINARSSGNPFNRLSTEQQEHVRNCVKKTIL